MQGSARRTAHFLPLNLAPPEERSDDGAVTKRKRVRKRRKDSSPSAEESATSQEAEDRGSIEDDDEEVLEDDKPTTEGVKQLTSDEQLLADIAAFKKAAPAKVAEEEDSVLDKAGDIFSSILVIDFFVVVGLLGWFVVGVIAKYAFGNSDIVISFRSNFDLVVQPAIGVLMLGTLAGAAVSKLNNKEEKN
ncbi:unnamed protein product [Heterosigma akashiwo]